MHRCHSHRGRARCDCHPGYQLAPDGKACQGGCPESSCAGKWLCLVGEGVLSVNRTEGSVPEMAQMVSVQDLSATTDRGGSGWTMGTNCSLNRWPGIGMGVQGGGGVPVPRGV